MSAHELLLTGVSLALVLLVGLRFAVLEIFNILDLVEDRRERRKGRALSTVDIVLHTNEVKASVATPTITTPTSDPPNPNKINSTGPGKRPPAQPSATDSIA
jgi:hypothetical protein